MSATNITDIPTERLTHALWEKGKEKATAEKEWIIAEHQRPILLAQLADYIATEEGCSHAVAERKARISKEYGDFVIKMGKAKFDVMIARTKYDAVDHEIKVRINRSFQDRSEYSGGRLNT